MMSKSLESGVLISWELKKLRDERGSMLKEVPLGSLLAMSNSLTPKIVGRIENIAG